MARPGQGSTQEAVGTESRPRLVWMGPNQAGISSWAWLKGQAPAQHTPCLGPSVIPAGHWHPKCANSGASLLNQGPIPVARWLNRYPWRRRSGSPLTHSTSGGHLLGVNLCPPHVPPPGPAIAPGEPRPARPSSVSIRVDAGGFLQSPMVLGFFPADPSWTQV